MDEHEYILVTSDGQPTRQWGVRVVGIVTALFLVSTNTPTQSKKKTHAHTHKPEKLEPHTNLEGHDVSKQEQVSSVDGDPVGLHDVCDLLRDDDPSSLHAKRLKYLVNPRKYSLVTTDDAYAW